MQRGDAPGSTGMPQHCACARGLLSTCCPGLLCVRDGALCPELEWIPGHNDALSIAVGDAPESMHL
eukprot:2863674-Pleurochrysis_carterae.AAC.1